MADNPRWLEYMLVAELPPAMSNPHESDVALIDASFGRFGFTEAPMLDERTGRLVAGHGRRARLIAWEQERRDPPDGIVLDDEGRWLLPVQRGWSSDDDDEAFAYLVTSNRVTEKAVWDLPELVPRLEDLASTPLSLEAVGFTTLDLDRMRAEAGITGQREGAFLNDLIDGHDVRAPTSSAQGPVYDGVELRLPMSQEERDEAVRLLRSQQQRRETPTLTATLLHVLRAASTS